MSVFYVKFFNECKPLRFLLWTPFVGKRKQNSVLLYELSLVAISRHENKINTIFVYK